VVSGQKRRSVFALLNFDWFKKRTQGILIQNTLGLPQTIVQDAPTENLRFSLHVERVKTIMDRKKGVLFW